MRKIANVFLSTTFWCVFGAFIGWYIGNQGGFKRGVNLTANLFIEMMQEKDVHSWPQKHKELDV